VTQYNEDPTSVIRKIAEHWQNQTPGQKETWHRMASGDIGKMTPYILFSNVMRDNLHRASLMRSGAPVPFLELGEQLGRLWKGLSDEERSFWYQQAQRIGSRS
jgi:hypothetical protein